MALPILQMLHKRHPEEDAIEKALDDCMRLSGRTKPVAVSSGPATIPNTFVYDAADAEQVAAPKSLNNIYFAPLFGSIVMGLSVFLPWFSISVAAGLIAVSATVNGLGNYSGSALLVNAASKSSGFGDGYFIIGLAVLAAIVSYAGLINKSKSAWKAAILFGVVAGGIIIYDWQNFTSKSSSITDTSTSSGVSAAVQVEPGLMVGVLGAIIIVIGGFAINSRASR